jgi:hypothetical protein
MVDLKLDPTREDVQALSRMITELEMKRDALYGKLMLLQEHADALKHATDWITKVGPGYSQAKNEQARLAEIKMLTADVWLRHALVDRVHSSFDEAYSHLGRQMDAISRLVTCDQNRLKHMEMRRGMAPHDDTPPWEDPKPKAQHSPRTLPPTEKDSEEGEDKGELFNQKMSQPLDPKKYKDLQSLPTDTSKLSAKGGRTFQKGDLNW